MVTASRNWVCVRPATYESAEEAEVLLGYFAGRQGTLENTVFALLDSDAKLISFRAGRSPGMLYDGPARMAEELTKKGKAVEENERRALPRLGNLRLALNVAACDSLPLVVAFAETEKERAALQKRLAPAAWDARLVGETHYVVCEPKELDAFEALAKSRGEAKSGLLVVQPDEYGRTATVLSELRIKLEGEPLTEALVTAVEVHDVEAREHRKHVREGKRQGYEWQGQIPSTDPDDDRGGRRERGGRGERGGR